MLVRFFQKSLKKRPLITHVIASGAISGAGDAFCQVAFEKRGLKAYDFMRTGRFVVLSSFFIAPSLNVWFKALERVKGDLKVVPFKRVVIDQILFSPSFNALILFILRMLEGLASSSIDQLLFNSFEYACHHNTSGGVFLEQLFVVQNANGRRF
uniref:Mitochondrial inner membrane protein Mpv17 n=1 Tax=Angiostrongylus cantonensis TaxID=6313 RepID=A0A0K0DKT8_ANGCA